MSTLVATTIDDDADDDDEVREIPLPNVKDAVLTKVIEYCTHYKEDPMTPIQTPLKSSKIEDLVQPWYAQFVKVDQVLLFEMVTAANFMDIKPLLDLTCLAVSIFIKVCNDMYSMGDGMTQCKSASNSHHRCIDDTSLSCLSFCIVLLKTSNFRGNKPVSSEPFSISAMILLPRKRLK